MCLGDRAFSLGQVVLPACPPACLATRPYFLLLPAPPFPLLTHTRRPASACMALLISFRLLRRYVATKMFVSNLNARLAQRFLSLVLLPRVRRDIAEHKRLHVALFQVLRKSTYKPCAFYKGLLLPLCASRSCTLREAFIFSSVLRRSSLPVLHSAAVLLRRSGLQ